MRVQIEVTTICNFSCAYCAGRQFHQAHMDWDQFAGILADLPDTAAEVMLQGEGEPSLHPRFWDMADAVRARGPRLMTIINGSRIDADRFAAVFDEVIVSVDTLDARLAADIGRHNLPKVLTNLEALIGAMGPGRVQVFSVDFGQDLAPLRAWLAARGNVRHVTQTVQGKPDYTSRYDAARLSARLLSGRYHYRCPFIETPQMRFYTVDGTMHPCCYIKDRAAFVSVEDIAGTLARHEVPRVCEGCGFIMDGARVRIGRRFAVV